MANLQNGVRPLQITVFSRTYGAYHQRHILKLLR